MTDQNHLPHTVESQANDLLVLKKKLRRLEILNFWIWPAAWICSLFIAFSLRVDTEGLRYLWSRVEKTALVMVPGILLAAALLFFIKLISDFRRSKYRFPVNPASGGRKD